MLEESEDIHNDLEAMTEKLQYLDSEEMATHSTILAWRIPQTEEPGGYSPWGGKEVDTTEVT